MGGGGEEVLCRNEIFAANPTQPNSTTFFFVSTAVCPFPLHRAKVENNASSSKKKKRSSLFSRPWLKHLASHRRQKKKKPLMNTTAFQLKETFFSCLLLSLLLIPKKAHTTCFPNCILQLWSRRRRDQKVKRFSLFINFFLLLIDYGDPTARALRNLVLMQSRTQNFHYQVLHTTFFMHNP